MTLARILKAGATAVLMLTAFDATAATLDGESFQLDYLYPDSSTVYSATNGPIFGTVGAGIDATIDVEGVTQIALDFSGLTLDVTLLTSLVNPVWNPVSFNGLRITFPNLASTFASFTTVATSFGPIGTGFMSNALLVNWTGNAYQNGSTASFSLALAPAPVPVPAALPLLLAGVGMIGALRLRRSRPAI